MPLARGQHTVMVFRYMQFLGDWTRFSGVNQIIYSADAPGELLVVADDGKGNPITYVFNLSVGSEVWVSLDENQVHIPTLCVKSEPGDKTKCRG